jgi:serine/threonine-protein kinase 19
MSLVPVAMSEGKLPPIVLRHQLYSVMDDRTQVDRELLVLRDSGKVRLFKLGVAEDEYALVWTGDYQNHVRTVLGTTQLCDKFLKVVLPGNQEVSISRQQLKEEMKLRG